MESPASGIHRDSSGSSHMPAPVLTALHIALPQNLHSGPSCKGVAWPPLCRGDTGVQQLACGLSTSEWPCWDSKPAPPSRVRALTLAQHKASVWPMACPCAGLQGAQTSLIPGFLGVPPAPCAVLLTETRGSFCSLVCRMGG